MKINLFSAGGGISLAPEEIFRIGDIVVTNTMVSALVTSLALILLAVVVRIFFIRRWRPDNRKVSGFQLLMESLVSMVDKTAKETAGHNSKFIGTWYFAVAAFICVGTLIEMTGLRPPTSDLNVTLAMGLTTFVLINVFGFKEKKLGRFRRYLSPLGIINIITDAVVPLSMALRLFGSVFSGYLIMHLIYGLPVFALIGIPAVASVMFTLFHALIQSYIFTVLSMNFIAEATE